MVKQTYKWIRYKKKGKEFGFQVVGYNMLQRMEMCIDFLMWGVISIKADSILKEK